MLVSVGMPSSVTRWRSTPRSRASLRPTDSVRSCAAASPKSTSTPGGLSSVARVADAGTGRHAADVGDGEQLRRRAVQAGPRRSDPQGDRDRGLGDVGEQLLHAVVADDGAAAVDLDDQRLRAVGGGFVDGVLDGVDDDLVEQPADQQHIDATTPGSGAVLAVVAVAGAGTCRGSEHGLRHRSEQQADR